MRRFPYSISLLLFVLAAGCAHMQPGSDSTTQRAASAMSEFSGDLVPLRRVVHLTGPPLPFATYAQCQMSLSLGTDSHTGLPVVLDANEPRVQKCVDFAVRESAHVLILPELTLAFSPSTRAKIIDRLRKAAIEHNMVIVAGTYYDSERYSRLPVIGPGWEELGYKLRPSRFEASPRAGFGMTPGKELMLLQTPYGRILPLTCVDLISDAVQYQVRNLANRGEVDVIANINYNPAAWEFLIEANGIARRHPVFVSITNISGDGKPTPECRRADNGYCFGNSALFGSLRPRDADCPNCAKVLLDLIETPFKRNGLRDLPYDSLAAHIPAGQEGLLVYELNLRLLREPSGTNAPDQGYPAIRALRRVPLQ